MLILKNIIYKINYNQIHLNFFKNFYVITSFIYLIIIILLLDFTAFGDVDNLVMLFVDVKSHDFPPFLDFRYLIECNLFSIYVLIRALSFNSLFAVPSINSLSSNSLLGFIYSTNGDEKLSYYLSKLLI